MVKASKGLRRGTRRKMKARVRDKFKVTPFLQKFKLKDKVVINQNPLSQSGSPHPRFKGQIGEIVGKRGKAYVIEVKSNKKIKRIIAKPEHLALKK
jgi:large subunit ribosomal protein L21e